MVNLNFERKLYLTILLTAGGLIFLFNLGGRDLWEPDETRYAVIAREMKESGHWILPHLNGPIYAEKPPLFFWLVNLSTFFWGTNNEVTNRLPSALAGFITMLMTFLFGSKLFDHRTGFFSALVLATCLLFPQISRWMVLDSLFTLFFMLTLFCFYCGYKEGEKRRRYYLLSGLFVGLAVLTKGPIAYLTILIILIFAFFQRDFRRFWNRDLLMAFLLSLVVVSIWLVPACLLGGEEYTKKILVGQIIGRLTGNGKYFHSNLHSNPFFFYLVRFPLEFFPWTVFLPAGFLFGLRKGQDKRREFLFLTTWFIFIFIFFSLSRGKKDNYILPLYPAAALMVGSLWNSGFLSSRGRKGAIPELLVLTSLFFIGAVLFLSGIPQRLYPGLVAYHSFGMSVFFYLLLGSSLSFLFLIEERKWASFLSLVITFAFFQMHISYVLPLKFDTRRSMKHFSGVILNRMESGDRLKTTFFTAGLLYYTRATSVEVIKSKDRFFEVLHSPERIFMVIQKRDLDLLERELGIKVSPIHQTRVGYRDLVLILNQDIHAFLRK